MKIMKKMDSIINGLRFGMILQFAIGPMCLLIFKTAASDGFLPSMQVVLAVTIVDFLYVQLASCGVVSIFKYENVKMIMKASGALVMILFGISTILGAFGIQLLGGFSVGEGVEHMNLFWQAFILTASNPLTILFWSGVFASQITSNHYSKGQIRGFGIGCILSTLLFSTLIAILGSTLQVFLTAQMIRIMNGVVGVVIIIFGIWMFAKNDRVDNENVENS